jgi:multiple sugar transport system permease protein
MRLQNKINDQTKDAWIFILPIVLGTILFSFYPVVFSLVASLSNWDGFERWDYVGLENFKKLLNDRYFIIAVKNTFVFTFVSVPISMALGMIVAVVVNKKIFFTTFYRTAFFIPSIASTVAIGLVFGLILVPNAGLLNSLLAQIGIKGPDWLGTSKWAMPSVIFVQVWLVTGYNMTVYIGGLQGIPDTLYEAAVIDGASDRQQFFRITVPLLSPTSFFLMITSIISSFQVFNLIHVMTNGGPAFATTTYIHYLYLNAFSYFRMGYASAQAWILFIVLVVITLSQKAVEKRWVYY